VGGEAEARTVAAFVDDEDEVLREHARWALDRLSVRE
jgi:hypothetical protein